MPLFSFREAHATASLSRSVCVHSLHFKYERPRASIPLLPCKAATAAKQRLGRLPFLKLGHFIVAFT